MRFSVLVNGFHSILVEEMLTFLTGDRWKICFRERKLTEIEKKAKEKWEKVTEKNVNISKSVCFLVAWILV